MTAITKPRNTKQMQGYPLPGVMSYPVAAGEVLYQGTLCMLKAGFLYDGAITTGAQGVGMVDPNQPDIDNSAGDDGDEVANVIPGVQQWANSANADLIAQDDVGKLCYIVDNQTVGLTDGTASRSIAGTIVGVDSSGVWVYANLAAPVDATALAAAIAAEQAYEQAIAATTSGNGAGLVGIFDTAGLYAAATVEAALAEVMQTALAKPVTGNVVLVTAVTGTTLYRVRMPYAGKLLRVDAVATVAPTTGGKALTLGATISGTAVTSLATALTSANLATLGNRISGTPASAANSFTAGQEIQIIAAAAQADFSQGSVEIQLFFGPQ